MKAQFCLMLLTLNGLLLCANSPSAAAATATPDLQVAHLSQTIATLIDFDDRNLVAQAINRALLAQNSKEDNSLPQLAGDVQQVTPKPIINGKIANPNPNPNPNPDPKNREGRPRRRPTNTPPSDSPNDPPVLINGIILKK
jgi:hypothetical protein